eukprot:3862607-Lingulodinium_polyedra.AAC.1
MGSSGGVQRRLPGGPRPGLASDGPAHRGQHGALQRGARQARPGRPGRRGAAGGRGPWAAAAGGLAAGPR